MYGSMGFTRHGDDLRQGVKRLVMHCKAVYSAVYSEYKSNLVVVDVTDTKHASSSAWR